MLRKLIFYVSVAITTVVFPIIGVLFTVAYTIFFVARAGVQAFAHALKRPQPA